MKDLTEQIYDELNAQVVRMLEHAQKQAERIAELEAQLAASHAVVGQAALASVSAGQEKPVATVIKKGADRQWMSENLGSLPDGTYSLYLAAPAAPQQCAEKVECPRCKGTGESSLDAALNWGEHKCSDCSGMGFYWEPNDEAARQDKDGNHADDLRGMLDELQAEFDTQQAAFWACSEKLAQIKRQQEAELSDDVILELAVEDFGDQDDRNVKNEALLSFARKVQAVRQVPAVVQLTEKRIIEIAIEADMFQQHDNARPSENVVLDFAHAIIAATTQGDKQ